MGDWREEIEREERVHPPVHPGEVIEQEWLEPLGMTTYQLAKEIGVPRQRMYAIVRGERAISGDTALRLERYFGMPARFWLGLQSAYDLELAKMERGEEIAKTVQPRAMA